jgi:HD-like signal output (HDOD) protein
MITAFNFHELKALGRLPSPSGTALAIMGIVQQDDATIEQLVHLGKADLALSGSVLGFANSAAFGARRSIATVQDAAMLMGMQSIKNIALSLSLFDKSSQGNCAGFDYVRYWSQSLAVAVAIAIAALTARERTASPDEAFTLGLLSDIGKLALASVWPDD